MKTETEIAKENVKIWKAGGNVIQIPIEILEEHLATCQRFLEFFETDLGWNWKDEEDADGDGCLLEYHKIIDLQNAIKIYEDAGIK